MRSLTPLPPVIQEVRRAMAKKTKDQPDLAPAEVEQRCIELEAVLMVADKAVNAGRLVEVLGIGVDDGGSSVVEQLVGHLNEQYEESGRSFRIERVAGGYRVMTIPEYAEVVSRFQQGRNASRLSQAALETLAIVAYRQPITRADVESIRGVACGEVIRNLLERRLVKITGRAEEVGRPMLYGTTRQFLETFGLSTLKDLPSDKELRQM
ncbi:MAG: SMC-Scp complex subunit ScpB [Planctomycetes bacterium]|nr:SMC-Scp complex subunit ScpB [Planctomycetota bacterium]